MDIKNLAKLDVNKLKEIKVSSIQNLFDEKPNTIIIILLMILTLGCAYKIFESSTKESSRLKSEISKIEERIDALKLFQTSEKKLDQFTEEFPEYLSSDQLIQKIFEIAQLHNVQILKTTQPTEKSDTFKTLTRITVTVSSDNYNQIVGFINEIEQSTYSVRVS